jgi:DamX protein
MVEQERGYLGMTHNPFANPGDGFFEHGDRKTHLEQLRHLSQWSRRVLLVTGPHDSGKSILYRQLSASLEPRAKAARVNGALINTSREILAAIAQGYGIAAPGNANTQLLTKLIAQHVEEQEASDRFCVALIDDAEIIEPAALDELLDLVGQCSMRLVLFGEVRFVPLVERLAKRHDVGWHEIRLTGFSAQDARDYLEWRFQEAKYRGRLPFTDQQVKEIVRLSEGLPGKINQMANVLMVKLESGDISERSRFPALHRALLTLVVVLVALAYLLWQQGAEMDVEEVMIAATEALAEVPSLEDLVPDDLVPDDPAAESIEPAFVVEAESESPFQPENQSALEDLEVESPQPVQEIVVVAPEPVIAPVEEVQQPMVGTGSRDGRWLLRQPEAAFTIQLLTLSSAERADAFLAEQNEAEQFATYQLQRDGRVLHVVVFGMFESRIEAQASAENLPDSVGNVRPWVRPMKQVHDAVKTALQQ